MPDDPLIELILHGREERNLEYKSTMSWADASVRGKICKAIMAMTNLRDGGDIVIGVERIADDSYASRGMALGDFESFVYDNVAEWANEYAAPFVEFSLDKIAPEIEGERRRFIVIRVQEFLDVPVVCRKSGVGLRPGGFYTRTRRKHETADVSGEPELREILDLAIYKGMRKQRGLIKELGFDAQPTVDQERLFQEELAGLVPDLLQRITARGHWEILIRPLLHQSQRVGLPSDARQLVENATVRLSTRGSREFPHFEFEEALLENERVELGTEYGYTKEFWRFYLSGQFVYSLAYWEDKMDVPWSSSRYPDGKPSKYLEILNALYQLTGVFEFAARLATAAEFQEGVLVSVTLTDTAGRDLVFWEGGRWLSGRYVCPSPNIEIKQSYGLGELVENSAGIALRTAREVFNRFSWHNPPMEILKEDQRRFIERQV